MEYLYRFLRLYNKTQIANPPDLVERFCWAVFIYLVLAVIVIQVAIAVTGYIRKKKKDKPAKESFKRKFLRSLVINLVIVILFFVCWEFAVRIYSSRNFKMHPFINPVKSWRLEPGLKNHPLDSTFGTITVASSNSEGLRNEEVPAKKDPDEIRILCLGDSWTMGQSVKENETFVRQLEKMLHEEYPDKKIRVINAGMFGYSVLQAYYLFRELRPKYKPDILITCGFNYVANREVGMYEEVINQLGPLGFIREFLNKSLVYLCLKKTISRFRGTGKSRRNEIIDTETAKKLYIKYSGKLYRESEKHGIKIIVFDHVTILPYELEKVTTPEGHRYCQTPYDASTYSWEENLPGIKRDFRGVRFFCIEPVGGITVDFFQENDPSHPTPGGHKSIAEIVFHIIVEGNYIE
ncbi:MAG: hypothetical protein K8T10_12310 [Candidatus Eremiobacteraeota bacterium]|nr:hypothetical protein [Candidatus Eremiobacteraeota bacterium]